MTQAKGSAADERSARRVSIPAPAVCRQRLPGSQFQAGLKRVCEHVNVQIVKRSEVGKFVVLPKRWIVERIISWRTDAAVSPKPEDDISYAACGPGIRA
jgi:hypothetical protein